MVGNYMVMLVMVMLVMVISVGNGNYMVVNIPLNHAVVVF